MKRSNDARARGHAAYWAFVVHRVSGLLLALFLPLHFWVLAQALHGHAAFDRWLRLADMPLFEFAEWGLVVLLSMHMVGGVRLLLIEFTPWSGLRKNWIAGAAGFSVATGMAFALALVT
ncbi:MAG: succinate dehydrogenase, cytochrome b556 subunit [Methylibium sp.]|uniref:succinate dehydrogenase, cytochrome b556 subunit n=1 Tax=Methylibium sp. TaxID=2067992 RepID=UPI001790F2F0|nr:succinate dehydrogenase, cytochrome b556 subunit [Methylibium sp.]MBA3597156.1 succinate dehydrogenase, cytochrome b556 subunit [Methylibium sp.]